MGARAHGGQPFDVEVPHRATQRDPARWPPDDLARRRARGAQGDRIVQLLMKGNPMGVYGVAVTRDGKWWMAEIESLGIVTQARRLADVEVAAREALALTAGV